MTKKKLDKAARAALFANGNLEGTDPIAAKVVQAANEAVQLQKLKKEGKS
jgi:hypothetical protein